MSEPTSDPEVKVVTIECLHCVLSDALDTWMDAFEAQAGGPAPIEMVGAFLGNLIEDVSHEIFDRQGMDGVMALREAMMQGQVAQRLRITEAEATPEPVVPPNPNTKH